MVPVKGPGLSSKGYVAEFFSLPKQSMYGIYTYIYYKNEPNVGMYTIHGSYGLQFASLLPRHDEPPALLKVAQWHASLQKWRLAILVIRHVVR